MGEQPTLVCIDLRRSGQVSVYINDHEIDALSGLLA